MLTVRQFFHILLYIAIILSIGTFGYLFIEDNWSLEDAFYMAVITITTVGFGEAHPLSSGGRLFTIFLILLGFSFVAYLGSQVARAIITIEIRRLLGRKTMEKKIAKLEKHYIVCGYGQIGKIVCDSLVDQKIPTVVIERNAKVAKLAEDEGLYVIEGDATSDRLLLDAGVERATGVISIIDSDANNLFIALSARELNPRIFIIARGEKIGVDDKILRAGADIVVSPLKLGGKQIANLVSQNSLEDTDYVIDSAMDSCFNTIAGLSLRLFRNNGSHKTVADAKAKSDAVSIVAVRHDDGTETMMPDENFQLNENDSLILLIKDKKTTSNRYQTKLDGKTVLIADDHRALRKLFAKKITAAGHETITAAEGDEAIRLIKEAKPDLIVSDVMMPNKNGYEVCAFVRQTPSLQHIPVILYSGDESDEFKKRGKEAGANACIQKTSRSNDLLNKIEELLAASAKT